MNNNILNEKQGDIILTKENDTLSIFIVRNKKTFILIIMDRQTAELRKLLKAKSETALIETAQQYGINEQTILEALAKTQNNDNVSI